MKTWILYALISMTFAGFTSVIAKIGLKDISGELGLAVRTSFVFLLIMGFTAFSVPASQLAALTAHHFLWLGLSGLTTSLSWIFYYKALKDGEVSIIALIDKGSMVVAILMAFLILKEPITLRTLLGAFLMIAGLITIIHK
ncbi:MAG: EamA family transporter [Methylacidiphilales bacterium]|nr:EamA family transporter [Candidatus Methylacidiphilales bacterium]MDW8349088.1 EamA family transporter [Verrucomicrobiae bacterium]